MELPDIGVTDLPAQPSGADLLRRALAGSTRRLVEHDPGTRRGDDPEALHQMRVAARRLRSDLRTSRDLIDREWSTALRTELRWLADHLGAVRDLDVLGAGLRTWVTEVPPELVVDAGRLCLRLSEQRDAARARLLGALEQDRYAALVDRLADASRTPRTLPAAQAPADELVRDLVHRPWRGLRRTVRRLEQPASDETLHRVRILAKRVRYAAEMVAPVAGEPAVRLATAAERLQDVLGAHQDAVFAAAWLRDAAEPESAFVAGWLASQRTAEARRMRDSWHGVWKEMRERSPGTW
jgi:CHAD domain-containing protein